MGWGPSRRRHGGQKVCSLPRKLNFLGFERDGTWDVMETLPGCPGPVGVFKKVCANKKVFAHCSAPIYAKVLYPREKLFFPHPFPPQVWARRHFSGRAGGGVRFEAPRGRIFIPALPTLERYFQGCGGGLDRLVKLCQIALCSSPG